MNESAFSQPIQTKILRTFKPAGKRFFDLYDTFFQYIAEEDESVFTEDTYDIVRESYRKVMAELPDEVSRTGFQDAIEALNPLLRMWDNGRRNPLLARRIGDSMNDIIQTITSDVGIFITPRKKTVDRFTQFRAMNPSEIELENLRKTNPSLYDSIQKNRESIRSVDQAIEGLVSESGLIVGRKAILGKPVVTGTDPATGEELVYDTSGKILPVEEYVQWLKDTEKAVKRINSSQYQDFSDLSLTDDEIRRLREDAARRGESVFVQNFGDLRRVNPSSLTGPVSYHSITDDKSVKGITRIFPTKDHDGRPVVVSGRYSGIYLDDLINAAGRLIEGSAYDYDPKTKKTTPIQTVSPEGDTVLNVSREPYVALTTKGELMLKIPSDHAYTAVREMARKVSGMSDTIQYVEKSRNSTFIFSPQDFRLIRDALGGFSMSKQAAETIRLYFEQRVKLENARSENTNKMYTAERIGGFNEDFKFTPTQRETLAWCETRGWSGLVAPDAGLGKCVKGDTLILTNKGLIPIQSLSPENPEEDTYYPVSDLSVQVGNKFLPVSAFYYNGKVPTVTVATNRGYRITGSMNHPIMIRDTDGEERWVRLSEMEEGMVVCLDRTPGVFASCEPELPFVDSQITNEIKRGNPRRMNPDLAKLIGFIVAEGYTAQENTFMVSQCSTNNPENHALIRKLLKEQLDWEGCIKEPKDIRISSTHLVRVLRSYGIGADTSHTKSVPEVILKSTKESVSAFLSALFDAEACVLKDGGVEFSTSSEKMAHQVHALLLAFGVVSTLSPKKVKGYEHTYWKITFFGNDALQFQKEIGMLSSKKRELLNIALNRAFNTNLNVVPNCVDLMERIRSEMQRRSKIASFGFTIISGFAYIRKGKRNPSYGFLNNLLDISRGLGLAHTPPFKDVERIVNNGYFYDAVKTVSHGEDVVMDLCVDHPTHTFIGNGFVNHNTAIAIGSMQKMYRDGVAGEAGRFLYVCPRALAGNLFKEMKKYIKDYEDLADRVDVMNYEQFTRKTKKEPGFADSYVAVFFDEVQEAKVANVKSRAIASVKNPRKILLTASPMERDPDELYLLIALSNNVEVFGPDGKMTPEFVAERRAWRSRYCVVVGGKVVAVKPDPKIREDFHQWVKSNLYYKEKTQEKALPIGAKSESTTVITMDPLIEAEYRKIASAVSKTMKDMVRKYRDRDFTNLDERVDSYRGGKLGAIFRKLQQLTDTPEDFIPGVKNPKIEQATSLIMDRLDGVSGRTLLFTDNKKLATKTVKTLSENIPGKLHAVAYLERIEVWRSGNLVKTYSEKYFRENRIPRPKNWAVTTLQEYLSKDPNVLTVTLTSGYTKGQNLQAFTTVIHLDRDTWNSEEMKQRNSRSWRTGQQNSVEVVHLDMVYSQPASKNDHTLDEIRSFVQQMDADLFNEIVMESQRQALGVEYSEIKQFGASMLGLNRRLFEQAMSPYATNVRS